jgi:hypothetical protein
MAILLAHMLFSLFNVQRLALSMMDCLGKQSLNFIWSIWLEGALWIECPATSYFMRFFPIFSERANHDLVSRLRLKEGSLINKSLASLGNVINALGKFNISPIIILPDYLIYLTNYSKLNIHFSLI